MTYNSIYQLTRSETTDGTTTIATVYYPDPVGRVTRVTDPEGKDTTYNFDDASRVTSVTNDLSQTTSYEYDNTGRRTRVLFANSTERLYQYDIAGQLIQTSGGPSA